LWRGGCSSRRRLLRARGAQVSRRSHRLRLPLQKLLQHARQAVESGRHCFGNGLGLLLHHRFESGGAGGAVVGLLRIGLLWIGLRRIERLVPRLPWRRRLRSLRAAQVWSGWRCPLTMLSASRRACRRVCWGGAGECSCGAPAVARHLPARVWRANARGLITPSCHRMKASAGTTRPTQSPSQTPQGGNTTGGEQHRGETAHGETHPPTVKLLTNARATRCNSN